MPAALAKMYESLDEQQQAYNFNRKLLLFFLALVLATKFPVRTQAPSFYKATTEN